MTKFIPDIKSSRWVILAPGRLNKPKSLKKEYRLVKKNGLTIAPECPFCPGNEHTTPPEICRNGSHSNWTNRVFPNKYPITDIHEVVVHHADHLKDIETMNSKELLELFQIYQERVKTLRNQGVPILFRNYGENAGTSIAHPHSQIILLPEQINLEDLALEPIKNVVKENDYFILYCPDFSQYPYEIWITHKRAEGLEVGAETLKDIDFGRFSEEELGHLSQLLQMSLLALKQILGNFSYNYYFSPRPPFFLRLIPRLLTRGGFEIGTGLSTNILDPSKAAEEIKERIKP
jgi:UDPglucose--hexose-1-phosphate uridylyltransferase